MKEFTLWDSTIRNDIGTLSSNGQPDFDLQLRKFLHHVAEGELRQDLEWVLHETVSEADESDFSASTGEADEGEIDGVLVEEPGGEEQGWSDG